MATIDLTSLPAVVTVTNNSKEGTWLPLAKSQTKLILDAGDSLKVVVDTSDELAYFLSLECEDLSVDFEAVKAPEDSSKA